MTVYDTCRNCRTAPVQSRYDQTLVYPEMHSTTCIAARLRRAGRVSDDDTGAGYSWTETDV